MPRGVYPRKPVDERFWEKVERDGPLPAHDPSLGSCWLWQAADNGMGYGYFRDGNSLILAHHFLIGKPPKGFEWDHLCRVTACIRPDHLDLVTHATNTRRGFWGMRTHCKNGHLFDEANTYWRKARPPRRLQSRMCRACHRERMQRLSLHSDLSLAPVRPVEQTA